MSGITFPPSGGGGGVSDGAWTEVVVGPDAAALTPTKHVHVTGDRVWWSSAMFTVETPAVLVCTLPVDHRPSDTVSIAAQAVNDLSGTPVSGRVNCSVTSDGEMSLGDMADLAGAPLSPTGTVLVIIPEAASFRRTRPS